MSFFVVMNRFRCLGYQLDHSFHALRVVGNVRKGKNFIILCIGWCQIFFLLWRKIKNTKRLAAPPGYFPLKNEKSQICDTFLNFSLKPLLVAKFWKKIRKPYSFGNKAEFKILLCVDNELFKKEWLSLTNFVIFPLLKSMAGPQKWSDFNKTLGYYYSNSK